MLLALKNDNGFDILWTVKCVVFSDTVAATAGFPGCLIPFFVTFNFLTETMIKHGQSNHSTEQKPWLMWPTELT